MFSLCVFFFNLLFHFFPVQLFVDYTAETYSKFMQGDDTFEDEDESFLTKLSKHSISIKLVLSKELVSLYRIDRNVQ